MSRAAAYAFWRLSRISLSRTARSTYGLTLSAALEPLSFVLGMLRTSFRWLAGRVYPRAGGGKRASAAAAALLLAVALAGCGGEQKGPAPPRPQTVRGTGFSFAGPAAWHAKRATGRVALAPGDGRSLVSVQRYRLLK